MTINLFGQPEIASPLPDDVQYFDIVNDNVCKDTSTHVLYIHDPFIVYLV